MLLLIEINKALKRYLVVELMYKEDIELFLEKANGHHLTIKLTTEVSEIETTFLDTTIYNGEQFEKK